MLCKPYIHDFLLLLVRLLFNFLIKNCHRLSKKRASPTRGDLGIDKARSRLAGCMVISHMNAKSVVSNENQFFNHIVLKEASVIFRFLFQNIFSWQTLIFDDELHGSHSVITGNKNHPFQM